MSDRDNEKVNFYMNGYCNVTVTADAFIHSNYQWIVGKYHQN